MNLPAAFEEKMRALLGDEFGRISLPVMKNQDIMACE